ncbi:T-box protein 12-like [Paramacrobiotus metropolitanus]|uniref:T-box protein 12-like n=1 Tax=Paramacrobiotus metropolitanus TaxID=2943436 RepID=UPI0024456B4C|nr:T-box protein 12-like [Paramacrobiotus metropolitanus]
MEPNFSSAQLTGANPKPKKKVTDFSIKAIMAERDEIVKEVKSEKITAFRKVKSPVSPKSRDSITPLSVSETPDTTTSDDVLPLATVFKEKPCSPELVNVQCHLEVKELWERFNELGTEMIITRSGRRMFPTIRVSFSGLDCKATYMVLMDIVTVDNKRYRYAYHRSSWLVAGKGDPAHHSKLYPHPDAPFLGEQLRKQIITFEKVKLTNTEVNKPGYIVLNSMHRYQPRIHLVMMKGEDDLVKSLKTYDDLQLCAHKTFVFPECAFYSVTAYQNQLITKLKIDCNPFAKGFRDSTRVITDLERDSLNNGGMLPDSTVFPYGNCSMSPNEPMNDLDAAIFSQKLAQFSRMIPGAASDSQTMPMYGGIKPFPISPTSIPLGILQKWSLAGLNAGLTMGANLDQRHLFNNGNMSPSDFARQLLFGKPIPAGPFYPFIGMDHQELAQKLKENGNF